MTDEDTCEKFHLSFERFVPPSFLFREKVSPALFQETKRNEGSWSLAHPVRRVGFYFFKKVVWHEVVWLLILMLLHCLSYMKHLICRTICFWYLYVNHMNAPWLTKKKGIYPIYMRPRSCCTTRWSGRFQRQSIAPTFWRWCTSPLALSDNKLASATSFDSTR